MLTDELPLEFQTFLAPYFATGRTDDFASDWLGQVLAAMNQVSTLSVASQILKDIGRGLSYSASSWKMLRSDRLEPALIAGSLSESRILEMLLEMEEHGQMHVLLYRIKPEFQEGLDTVLNPTRVKRALREHKLGETLDALPSPKAPGHLTLTHVRFEDDALVFKAIETKIARRPIRGFAVAQGQRIQLEEAIEVRRVKLARLHPSGLLEVRIGSLRQSKEMGRQARNDHSYDAEAQIFLQHFGWLVQPTWFKHAHAGTFRRAAWNQPDHRLKVLRENLATDAGNKVNIIAKHRRANVASDDGVQEGRQVILGKKGSSTGKLEVLWHKAEVRRPHADVTVRVPETVNEFAFGQATSAADYENVFRDILRIGRL